MTRDAMRLQSTTPTPTPIRRQTSLLTAYNSSACGEPAGIDGLGGGDGLDFTGGLYKHKLPGFLYYPANRLLIGIESCTRSTGRKFQSQCAGMGYHSVLFYSLAGWLRTRARTRP